MAWTTVQKWLVILGGLGALSIIASNPQGFYSATNGVRQLIGGSASDVIKAGRGK